MIRNVRMNTPAPSKVNGSHVCGVDTHGDDTRSDETHVADTRGAGARVVLSRFDKGKLPTEQGESLRARPCFALSTLLDDVARHEELDLHTLTYHVRQSDATAADGYWHASINEARSFLEALLVGMLCHVRVEPADAHRNTSRNGTPFRCLCRRLVEAGFIDADENEMLQYVYSVASAKGSHHGVTDEAWTRLARRMVWVAGQYLLAHYEAWKSGHRKHPAVGRLDRRRFGRSIIKRLFGTLDRRRRSGRSAIRRRGIGRGNWLQGGR